LIAEQLVLKFAANDAEVGLEQVVDGEAGVGVQLLGNSLLVGLGELIALCQRSEVGAGGKGFDLFEEGLEAACRLGQLVVIDGDGGVGGQREGVGEVIAVSMSVSK
jgi:hypothetical protein